MPGQDLLADPLRERWSISVYDASHQLTDAQLEAVLQAARWSSSAGNTQPWRFVVCPRGSEQHALLVGTLSRGNSGWVPRASAVVVTAVQTGPDPDDPETDPGPKSPAHALYDLGQAAAHLTVQAHATGLHAHPFAGFDADALADLLGVPPHWRLMTGIALGVPGDPGEVDPRDAEREQRPRTRKPLGEIAYAARWGEPWEPTRD